MRAEILLAGFLLILGSGCEKQAGFVNPALVPGGVSYYPVSDNPLVDSATGAPIANGLFFAGDTLSFEVDFDGQDTLSGLSFYAGGPSGETLVESLPFQSSDYSFSKQIDTAVLHYPIPTSAPSGTEILLDIVIRNTNSLSLTRTIHFRVL